MSSRPQWTFTNERLATAEADGSRVDSSPVTETPGVSRSTVTAASTAAIMQALGIRIWPPGIPPANCLLNGRPKTMSGQLYSSFVPGNYSYSTASSTLYTPNNIAVTQPSVPTVDGEIARRILTADCNDSRPRSPEPPVTQDQPPHLYSATMSFGTSHDLLDGYHVPAHELLPADVSLAPNRLKRRHPEPDSAFYPVDGGFSGLPGSPYSPSSAGANSTISANGIDMSCYLEPFPALGAHPSTMPMHIPNMYTPAASPGYSFTSQPRMMARCKTSSPSRSVMQTRPYTPNYAIMQSSSGNGLSVPSHTDSPLTYEQTQNHDQVTTFVNRSPSAHDLGIIHPTQAVVESSARKNMLSPPDQPYTSIQIPKSQSVTTPTSNPAPPQETFKTLNSNVNLRGYCLDYYVNTSSPPDLFSALHDRPSSPPPEDFTTEEDSDSQLIPHEQELRFENDMYTPRWVRGRGNKREGWCGLCKPGRWLVLKNSAFWYDKCFTHGICAATGQAFEEPRKTRRMDTNPDIWEGLCGVCDEWVAMVSSKKKGTTWFRHAYRCHNHAKARNPYKRQRLDDGGAANSSADQLRSQSLGDKRARSSSSTPSAATPLAPETKTRSGDAMSHDVMTGIGTATGTGTVNQMISPLHAVTSLI